MNITEFAAKFFWPLSLETITLKHLDMWELRCAVKENVQPHTIRFIDDYGRLIADVLKTQPFLIEHVYECNDYWFHEFSYANGKLAAVAINSRLLYDSFDFLLCLVEE